MSCIWLDALLNRELNGLHQNSIGHYEEVINHFLKVYDNLFSYFVAGCVHGKFWQ